MRLTRSTALLLLTLVMLCASAPPAWNAEPLVHSKLAGSAPNLAYRWLDIAQEATAREVDRNSPRPTVISRTLAVWATAMYDAWAA